MPEACLNRGAPGSINVLADAPAERNPILHGLFRQQVATPRASHLFGLGGYRDHLSPNRYYSCAVKATACHEALPLMHQIINFHHSVPRTWRHAEHRGSGLEKQVFPMEN